MARSADDVYDPTVGDELRFHNTADVWRVTLVEVGAAGWAAVGLHRHACLTLEGDPQG